ncbi:MAG: hypothetical protein RLZZ59_42 [Pseudomonadota bacterium]|jgi:hypothetical protein
MVTYMFLVDKIKSMTPEMITNAPNLSEDLPLDQQVVAAIAKLVKIVLALPDFLEHYIDKMYVSGASLEIKDLPWKAYGITDFRREFNDLFFNNRISQANFETLKKVMPEGIISEAQWKSIDECFYQTGNLRHKTVENSNAEHMEWMLNKSSPVVYDENIRDLYKAAKVLYDEIPQGDLAVFVGNTPQLIRYVLDKHVAPCNQKFKTVSLGISGCPDNMKWASVSYLLEGILTEDGDLQYKQYMQEQGLTSDNIQHHKVHFIDLVGGGGGIAYLSKATADIAFGGDIDAAKKHMDVIGIAEVDVSIVFYDKDIETSTIDFSKLGMRLDKVSDNGDDRVMPNVSAGKWCSDPNIFGTLDYISANLFDTQYNKVLEVMLGHIDRFSDELAPTDLSLLFEQYL